VAEVDGVPEDDGGDREVQAGGTVALVFEGAVPDLAVTMEMFQPRMLVTMGVRLAGRSAHNRRLRPKTHRAVTGHVNPTSFITAIASSHVPGFSRRFHLQSSLPHHA
jgi:hypothetical protein